MGILDKLRGEFIDIIEWLDPSRDTMIFRFERYGNEIKNGAKLVCRESQAAVFVNEGRVADVFTPGTYTLETKNLPILATLMGWKYGFNSPFKAEVYFVNTKNFTDQKWGTKNPVMMRDAEFGAVRIRAFGNYTFKVVDPAKLIREIAGTDKHFTTDEISEQLRNIIITRFTDFLAESKIAVLDLAAKYDELSKGIADKVSAEFKDYGIEVTKLLIENVSLPPAVEEAMDKRTSMGVVGNLGAFTQYQAAMSMEQAAKNPGGAAGAGIGMGMGFAMANQLGQQVSPSAQQPGPPPLPGGAQFFAAVGGQQTGPHTEQALGQLAQQGSVTRDTLCWKQGMAQWTPAGQVPELAKLFAPPLPPPLPK
ncbi:MAG: SPFH domain-containing protein [Planctomycetota bacterium]|nr:SPFH domain-containing protein [Planctomycetota bacterium]